MLESVKSRLSEGDRDGARAALREELSALCVARFVSGWTRHPLLDPKCRPFLSALREVVRDLVGDPLSGGKAFEALGDPREAGVNLCLERILPDFALLIDEAMTDAKHELGGRASNVESENDGRFPSLFGWQAGLVASVAEEAFKAGASSRLDALERVTLADLDEGGAGIVDDLLVFTCPCGAERREPLDSAGTDVACDCGQVLTVPRARLDLMAAYLKKKRDAARGISRCRVCKGIIQLGKQGFMRAGFCGPYCAKRGQELFREYVARAGTWAGGVIVFACVCGQELRAAEADVGTKRPCEGCGIEVWVPLAATGKRPKGVGSCAHCGRVMKASAARCMYCGRPV
jgi:hypothetical protein